MKNRGGITMAKDMYQKRKERKNKDNYEEINSKTNINWEITTYEKLPRKAYK